MRAKRTIPADPQLDQDFDKTFEQIQELVDLSQADALFPSHPNAVSRPASSSGCSSISGWIPMPPSKRLSKNCWISNLCYCPIINAFQRGHSRWIQAPTAGPKRVCHAMLQNYLPGRSASPWSKRRRRYSKTIACSWSIGPRSHWLPRNRTAWTVSFRFESILRRGLACGFTGGRAWTLQRCSPDSGNRRHIWSRGRVWNRADRQLPDANAPWQYHHGRFRLWYFFP